MTKCRVCGLIFPDRMSFVEHAWAEHGLKIRTGIAGFFQGLVSRERGEIAEAHRPAKVSHDAILPDPTQPCPVCGTHYADPVIQRRHLERAHAVNPRRNPWSPAPDYGEQPKGFRFRPDHYIGGSFIDFIKGGRGGMFG